MIIGEEKPSLDELAHYGVLGMKWGQRKKATGQQIHDARDRLKKKSSAYRKEYKKLSSTTTPAKRRALENKLRKMHQNYLKSPDRVIASRTTAGEKIASLFFAAGSGPGAVAAPLGVIAGSSIASRRIEYKQDRGDYDKLPKGPIKKRIGFQTGRSVVVNGALMAPTIIELSSGLVILKAAANRKAARAAYRGPKGIASAASKIDYAKLSRGVYNITSKA